jgi:hypothetical protein
MDALGGMVLTHAPLDSFNVSLQETIDHIVEFHQALIFPEIVLGFA